MANFNQKVDFLTESIIKYVKENDLDVNNNDHIDILTDYIYNRFKIKIAAAPIKKRLKKLL